MEVKKVFSVIFFSFLFLSSCQNSFINSEYHNIQIYFKYGHKNVLNTFETTFQKDMVLDGVIKIKFYLTPEELNQIFEKANSINFFSLPDTFKYVPVNGITKIVNPNPGEQILRIKYQQKDKKIIWTYPLNDNFPDVKDLMELKDLIISIILSKPEYKKLPTPKSGYL